MCQYFVCSSAFIFRPLYSYPYISYTIFIEVLLLYFVRYIHGHMKSFPIVTTWRYSPRFRLLQPWALILHYCEKLVIAKSIQLSSVNFYGLLQSVTTWTRKEATYCGRLGQHGKRYNTNMRPSFSNSRVSKAQPSVWKARPSFSKALPSVSKARLSFSKARPH